MSTSSESATSKMLPARVKDVSLSGTLTGVRSGCFPPPLLTRLSPPSSEHASKTYTTEVVTNIFSEEGAELFDCRSVSLGHTLQGGVPSPRDRTRAIRQTIKCIDFLEKHFNRKVEGKAVDPSEPDVATIVIEGPGIRFASVQEMMSRADFKNRRGKTEWWFGMSDMIAVMSGRESPPPPLLPSPRARASDWPGSEKARRARL